MALLPLATCRMEPGHMPHCSLAEERPNREAPTCHTAQLPAVQGQSGMLQQVRKNSVKVGCRS